MQNNMNDDVAVQPNTLAVQAHLGLLCVTSLALLVRVLHTLLFSVGALRNCEVALSAGRLLLFTCCLLVVRSTQWQEEASTFGGVCVGYSHCMMLFSTTRLQCSSMFLYLPYQH